LKDFYKIKIVTESNMYRQRRNLAMELCLQKYSTCNKKKARLIVSVRLHIIKCVKMIDKEYS
jgi:hypothetical protein